MGYAKKRALPLLLALAVLSGALAIGPGAGAAPQDAPILEMSHAAGAVALNGLGATLTVPYSYASGTVNLSELQISYDTANYIVQGQVYSPGALATVGVGAVTLSVTYAYAADPTLPAPTLAYTIAVVRAAPVPAAFSGTVAKSASLPAAAPIAFAPEDFAACYAQNDGDPLAGISISASSGSLVGVLKLSGADYAFGTLIPIAGVSALAFEVAAAGAVTFDVIAHTASATSPQQLPGVALAISVSATPAPTPTVSPLPSATPTPIAGTLSEISYNISRNSALMLSDSDFISAFEYRSGVTLYYVQFSQPSSSFGRLYYNYYSTSSYDRLVTSSERYFTDSSPRLSNITFMPALDYTGTDRIYYTASGRSGLVYEGWLRVTVDAYVPGGYADGGSGVYGSVNTVTYSAEKGAPVFFSAGDFNTAFTAASGYQLYYVRFSPPPESVGRLLYNYSPSAGGGSLTASDTRYYRGSSPDISNLAFVPHPDYSGTYAISYTAFASNGHSLLGTAFVSVGRQQPGPAGSVSYESLSGSAVKLNADDFASVFAATTGFSLYYAVFSQPPASDGRLRYGYQSAASPGSAVSSSVRYYRTVAPYISNITFEPTEGRLAAGAKPVSLRYTAYATNGFSSAGEVAVYGPKTFELDPIELEGVEGEPLRLSADGIQDAVEDASGEDLDYVTFKLPSSRRGVLYYDYDPAAAGGGRQQRVKAGEAYYYGRSSPRIERVSFVPAPGYSGETVVAYEGFDKAGGMYEGELRIKAAPLPAGWARAEVASLAARGGVAPDELMSGYGQPITRAQFTALLVNAYEYARGAHRPEYEAAFADISRHRFAEHIRKGYSLGIVNGVSDDAFQPDAPLTREQAAKIICAAAGAIEDVPVYSDYSPPYADLGEISEWALPFVAYAAERGLMNGASGGMFLPLGSLSREEALVLAERLIVACGY
ncbi:MAG: S-layer homology domain-containing protein [Clostridiales bacterium]|jgi:hypothetical protein|nr:S-layer homology domain-containing protein [Clostridiales bacterium]